MPGHIGNLSVRFVDFKRHDHNERSPVLLMTRKCNCRQKPAEIGKVFANDRAGVLRLQLTKKSFDALRRKNLCHGEGKPGCGNSRACDFDLGPPVRVE